MRDDVALLGLDHVGDGRFRFVVADHLSRLDGRLYGGTAIAASIVAAELVSHRRPLWMTTQFVSTVAEGAVVDMVAEVLAPGRRTNQVRVTGTSEDGTTVFATASPDVAARRRWPYVGRGQQILLWASVLILVGAFLPWLMTGVGMFTGMRGAGTWTVFAGAVGVGASLMRSRRLVLAHAIGIAVVAIALPIWQVVHVLGLVGFGGWLPGIGLIMTFAGGIAVARAAAAIRADG